MGKGTKRVKSRGRPPLPPEEGKRVPLNMRTTQDLRDKIEAAAKAAGRSIAQEVEIRLERSFHDDGMKSDLGRIETAAKEASANAAAVISMLLDRERK